MMFDEAGFGWIYKIACKKNASQPDIEDRGKMLKFNCLLKP